MRVDSESPVPRIPVRLLPYPPDHFAERGAILDILEEATAPGGTRTALVGLPGVGKRQIALQFAHRWAQENPDASVFWVNATSRMAVESGYREIADRLSLELPTETRLPDLYNLLVEHGQDAQNGQWLLVMEGADDWQEFSDIFLVSPLGRILLTTRDATIAGFVDKVIWVRPLGADESVRFLEQRLQSASLYDTEAANALRALAEFSGGLPLVLEQSAAYIRETGIAPASYVALLRSETTPTPGDALAGTLAFAMDDLQTRDPAAADLVRACAFLHHDQIPHSLFAQTADVWPKQMAQICHSLESWYGAVRACLRFSLLQHEAGDTLSTHPAVQQALQERLGEEGGIWLRRVVSALNRVLPAPGFAYWDQSVSLLPHLLAVAAHITRFDLRTVDAAQLLNQTGVLLTLRGDYERALPLSEHACELLEEIGGAADPDAAAAQNNLAELYRILGRYEDALPLYEAVLETFSHTEDTSRIATVLNNLAETYRRLNRYNKALPLYRRAVRLYESLGEEQTQSLATALDNLAALYEAQNKPAEARKLYERSMELRRRTLGENHPDFAESLNDLATYYDRQGNLPEALRNNQRALEIFTNVLGNDHPRTAVCRNNRGILLAQKGDFEGAGRLLEQARPVLERSLKDHPRTAVLLANLAQIYCTKNDLLQAVPLSERALTMIQRILGDKHPQTIQIRQLNQIVHELAEEEFQELLLRPLGGSRASLVPV